MPLPSDARPISLDDFSNYERIPCESISKWDTGSKKEGNRKIWFTFHYKEIRNVKIFECDHARLVTIDDKLHFCESLYKDKIFIGMAFKKVSPLFIANNSATLIKNYLKKVYRVSSEEEDKPDFMILNKEFATTWADS
ncbi:MAG: hypothetical protein JWM20_328 [Patescibacteria group bacterium]|nr:hypothetical protein [Patescibacteria group bacterium]